MTERPHGGACAAREWIVLCALLGVIALLAARAYVLHVRTSEYLRAQGEARHSRVEQIVATRGMVLDRNGEPIAVSTPVDSVWAHPATLAESRALWPRLAQLLGTTPERIGRDVERYAAREFMYLRRHLTPELAAQVMALQVPGVALRREYRRYYPAAAVTGHVLGFTDIDDRGQEGIELAYDSHLAGVDGLKRVLRDRLGRIVEDLENIRPVVDGYGLTLSLDSRIQHLTHQHLQAAFAQHRAVGASAVVLDPTTGEVLAMVNAPSFNPNNRDERDSRRFRNRAATDVLEPGSTMKPFTVALALARGKVSPDTHIDTAPGVMRIGRHMIRDVHDYGALTVSRVLVKSSNIGAAKIAMRLSGRELYEFFRSLGFGAATDSGLPGEVGGSLSDRRRWRRVEQATLSYGYGLSATPLQLARAYAVLANDGKRVPITMLRRRGTVIGEQVVPTSVVRSVRAMLELAASEQGTAARAQIPYYRVAGKTGTVHKLTAAGYAPDRYVALFAGFAPVTDPRLVVVIIIDEPRAGKHYGGDVAAPVFAKVMADALRLRNAVPDKDTVDMQRLVVQSTRLGF